MSGEELGRPKYTAPQASVGRAAPLQPPAGSADGGGRMRRNRPAAGPSAPLWSEPADVLPPQPTLPAASAKAAKTKPVKPPKKRDEPVPEAPPATYPPTAGRGIGYVLWHVLRFTVLAVVWLAMTMVKVALSPFTHIGGGGRPHWD